MQMIFTTAPTSLTAELTPTATPCRYQTTSHRALTEPASHDFADQSERLTSRSRE